MRRITTSLGGNPVRLGYDMPFAGAICSARAGAKHGAASRVLLELAGAHRVSDVGAVMERRAVRAMA